jgi:hypothetical protein
MRELPFPYIVGMTRSGTTLLRAMLASHADLDIPDEAPFVIDMSLSPERYEGSDGLDLQAFVSDLRRHRSFRAFGLPEDEVRSILQQEDPRSFSDAIRSLFRAHAAKLNKSRYGHKTPSAVNLMPHLSDLFPEALFIHMIRDGRDVALSHTSIESGIHTVGEVAVLWKNVVTRGRTDGETLGPERYLEVQYEDLVDDPESVLRTVCGALELSFEGAMLRYYERATEIIGSPEEAPLHKSVYLPPTTGLRDWRRQMSRSDVETFEAVAGDLLAELGYERAMPRVPARMRVKAIMVRFYVSAKQHAKRVLRRSHP